MNTLTTEVFAVGKWNGKVFSKDDLGGIVNAFNNLKSFLSPPVKLGHNDEQPLKDGDLALGYIDDIWVEGEKLIAKLVNVPDIVYKALKKKLYKKVSLELHPNVTHKGIHYKNVLTGIALLGADLPAVNVLNDIGNYFSLDDSELTFNGNVAVFTAISGQKRGDNMAEIDEKELAELRAKAKEAETFKTKVNTLENEAKQREENERINTIKTKRSEVTSVLEEAVTKKHITPAQRDSFTNIIGLSDDSKVMDIDINSVKEFINSNKPSGDDGDTGRINEDEDVNTDLSASDQLDVKINEYMVKHGEKDYETAMFAVMRANPKLGEQFKLQNGTTKY